MQIKKEFDKLVDKIEKANIYIIFTIILFVQIVFMLYYCNMKQEFFVDEIWSYGLSNSYYKAQLWDNNDLNHLKMWKEVQEKQNGLSGNCFYIQLREFWHILQHRWQLHLCLELYFVAFHLYLC